MYKVRSFWVWWILVAVWMGVIFSMSAQNAEQSSAKSSGFTVCLLQMAKPLGLDTAVESALTVIPIRKAGHFIEYAVLGVLCLCAWRTLPRKYSRASVWAAWLLCVWYACLDEWHQAFVPGRSPEWRDVGIDAAGALLGVLTAVLVAALYRRRVQHAGE